MVLSTPTTRSACDMTRRFLRLDYMLHPLEKTITNPNLVYPEYRISSTHEAHACRSSEFQFVVHPIACLLSCGDCVRGDAGAAGRWPTPGRWARANDAPAQLVHDRRPAPRVSHDGRC